MYASFRIIVAQVGHCTPTITIFVGLGHVLSVCGVYTFVAAKSHSAQPKEIYFRVT